jgi:orotidine-5'-phosphate decarboxylase
MEKIIIPLDGFNNMEDICALIDKIQAEEFYLDKKIIWGFKINDALLHYGVDLIAEIKSEGFRVFADPKLYDIPNTIHNSIKILSEAGADIISVHASAQYIPFDLGEASKLAGITILTSFDEGMCNTVYRDEIYSKVGEFKDFILNKNYGYLVCSSEEIIDLNLKNHPNLKKIVPGIRPSWYKKSDDQTRIATPSEAIKDGADLLVIGRPILESSNIIGAINLINQEIEENL